MPAVTSLLPLIPLRDFVLFPAVTMPIFIGRAYSIEALARATRDGRSVFLVAQKNAALDAPAERDLYTVGTVAQVVEHAPVADSTRVLVSGLRRARLIHIVHDSKCLEAEVEFFNDPPSSPDALRQIREKQAEAFNRMVAQTSVPELRPNANMRVAAMQKLLEGDLDSALETDVMRLQRLWKLFGEFARTGNPD